MKQIKLLFAESSLTNEEQNELLAVLKLLPATELNELYNFLENHPEWVGKLHHNFLTKKWAANSHDRSLWQKILKEEEIMLKEIDDKI